MHEVWIVGAKRTPIGDFLGKLKDVSAVDLGVTVVNAALAQAGVSAAQVQEVETTTQLADNEIILDIRSPDDHEDKPFEPEGMTVIHLPFYKLSTQFGDLDQSKTYLLYCERSVMSKLQALYLKEQGFNNIKVYRQQ